MIEIPEYRELLMHEIRRKRHDDYMSDVYDAPRSFLKFLIFVMSNLDVSKLDGSKLDGSKLDGSN